MKKIIIAILIAALCAMNCVALAESGRIDDRLFNMAKQTMFCIDTGDFPTASALLGCVDTETLMMLTQNFTTLGQGTAQTRIAVAFFAGGMWYLAVPTAEPSVPEIETLLLTCGAGDEFQAVQGTYWGSVQTALDMSEAVIWNEEYVPGVFIIED